METYQKKQIDPKENILYGNTSQEEFIRFSFDTDVNYPIRVEMVGITHADKNYFISRKHSDYFILEYVCSGKGYITCGGQNYSVETDCVYLLQPGMAHKYGADKKDPYEKIWINFFSGIFADIFAAYGLSDRVVFPNSECKPYFEEILRLAKENSNNDKSYLDFSDVLFSIIVRLAKNIADHQRLSDTARLIKEALDNSVYRSVTIEQLAEEINISKSSVSREFKKYYAVSPYQYLLDRKINIAKRLLATTNMRVSDVSEQLGFSDKYYFSNIFKEKIGLSPRDYRNTQKQL